MTIKVSIVIPVYNGLNYTRQCLANLVLPLKKNQETGHIVEIIVVDDGSTDGTAEWVKQNYPGVHLLSGDGNLWWSGGINMGSAYAINELKSDFVLWWNNDILCREDYFTQLFSLIEKNKDIYIMGSKIYIQNENLIWGMGGIFDPVRGIKGMYGERQQDTKQYHQPVLVDWLPGMGSVIHKKVFQTIGYVDAHAFPQYHGDSDFTFRAKKAGFKIVAYPELVLYNDISNTGMKHKNSFRNMYISLFAVKSYHNVHKNLLFLQKHATSKLAYFPLIRKYFNYMGGFLKWKILSAFGIKKNRI